MGVSTFTAFAAVTRDPAGYALGGVEPAHALRPASTGEAAEVVRACAVDRLALVPWGGGVALAGERFPGRYDVALDLGALDRITHYEPDDFTVTAECGVTLATLRAALLAHGHELPLEAAHASRATLGGVLAANASGARRLRFGAPRDRILGARFVTGDGVLARTGGRVVKNVAGHAVHRLLTGSRGGLGVLLEARTLADLAPMTYHDTIEQMPQMISTAVVSGEALRTRSSRPPAAAVPCPSISGPSLQTSRRAPSSLRRS